MAKSQGRKATETAGGAQARLIGLLEARFRAHGERRKGISWSDVVARLDAAPGKLKSLAEMERTGGEPDVIGRDHKTGAILFVDCSPESPAGRRSLCYDRAGLLSRKEARPVDSAVDVAAAMGAELLDEAQYRNLQALGPFDARTSSWLKTPAAIRERGGALFGDFRYGAVFIYHNGAQSYYAGRGFRAALYV
jgi:hypothetical protein